MCSVLDRFGMITQKKSLESAVALFPMLIQQSTGIPFFPLGLEQASENTGGAIKNKCRESIPYPVGQVHDPLHFFITPVKFLSIQLKHFHNFYSSRYYEVLTR